MAAGSEATSGNSRGSSALLESTFDRRLQGLTNTMESIQGLSTWCIENKKYHSVFVRSWLKWVRKSDASQRLNLFYLANDIIQNCKRKNAIVYRTTFTDVLPEAVRLINSVKDPKVRKSVDRILGIWEERSVYSEELINQLRSSLSQQEEPPAPANQKAALRSKIVAEFVPSAFIEHLAKYRNSMDEIELREKQLAAMRVDVCSTTALKKLKDKAGGKRFSKDFEDGSAKLQDFVAFLNAEVQKGPALMEALKNADIFYEMQYKEVKIVTNAYQTFANRVLHLKRKLDALKGTLPDPDDSPIPSPSEDAPSPTGSESPFHSLSQTGDPDPEPDGKVMEEELIALGDAPSPLSSPGDRDNRDVEDMELSDVEETVGPSIIVEERAEQPDPVCKATEIPDMEPSQSSQAAPEKIVTTPTATATSTTSSIPFNLVGVDLGKISSIISTLTNVMKSSASGVSPASRTPAITTTTSTTQVLTPSTSVKSPAVSTPPSVPPSSSLANILSRVDINPSTLLSVLSKTQTQGAGFQGLSSIINNQTGTTSTPSGSDVNPSPDPSFTTYAHPSPKTTPLPFDPMLAGDSNPQGNVAVQSSQSPSIFPTRAQQEVEKEKEPITFDGSTLDSKIDSFLQGNPGLRGFNLGFPSVLSWSKGVNSPSTCTENLGGTPVRDESGATPTQDEVMDDPVVQPFLHQGGPVHASTTAVLADSSATPAMPSYANPSWHEQNRHGSQYGPGSQSGGERYQKDFTVKQDFQSSVPSLAEMGHHQHIEKLLPSLASNKQLSTETTDTVTPIAQAPYSTGKGADTASLGNDGWYSDAYGDGQERHANVRSEAYRGNQHRSQDPRCELNPPNFFNSALPPPPPIPQLPPPPRDFLPPVAGGIKDPVELPDADDKLRSGEVPAYGPGSGANYDYDERLSSQNRAKESFPPHLNVSGPQHGGGTPRPALPANQNGPMNYNPRPRVPVLLQRHPGMPPSHPGPPSAGRGFAEPPRARAFSEPPNRPQAPPEEPYLDQQCDAPSRSPSRPPAHEFERPHMFYSEERPLLPRHPEHRLRPRLEHRHPPPQNYPSPRPGHFPPQRPLRRPPPPHMPHPREPSFQRGKRPGAPFGGPPRPGGPFYPPKRPFLPPRY